MAERGARLLVADDNKVNRLLLGRTLSLQGHQVSSADNGRQALQMLRSERFDLLLLDLPQHFHRGQPGDGQIDHVVGGIGRRPDDRAVAILELGQDGIALRALDQIQEAGT